MTENERLTRERDDAWEARDAWHARVAHIAQALGMQPPPSGDWRDVDAASVERAAASQRAELEAARAVVEASRRFDEATNPCDLRAGIYAAMGSGDEAEPVVDEAYESADALAAALKAYDAAKAGKAVE